MIEFFTAHWIEITGTLAGFIYIFLEIKEKPLMWPVGILTSAMYVVVFYTSKFYADMGLNVYYVLISIYGWYWWISGAHKKHRKKLPISRMNWSLGLTLLGVTVILFLVISYILKKYTDSPLPHWDAFTTACSITATWMLARKILEHWMFWWLVNLVSAGLYFYKELYFTTVLFAVYFFFAVIGFIEWKKSYYKELKKA